MPEEDKVQIAPICHDFNGNESGAVIVEMGARGQAVELLAIHYHLTNMGSDQSYVLEVGLSSNPENEGFPLPSSPILALDKSVYGYYDYGRVYFSGIDTTIVHATRVIPLYGLVRPRRQVLMWIYVGTTSVLRAEIYYRPVALSRVDLDSLNLKYGKYRRSA